jgi:hypothetical protein
MTSRLTHLLILVYQYGSSPVQCGTYTICVSLSFPLVLHILCGAMGGIYALRMGVGPNRPPWQVMSKWRHDIIALACRDDNDRISGHIYVVCSTYGRRSLYPAQKMSSVLAPWTKKKKKKKKL